MRAFHARVRPLQHLLRRGGEHHEQAHGVGAVAVDHGLRVDAVVLGLGHLLGAADDDRLAVGDQPCAGDAALVVKFGFDLRRVVPGLLADGVLAVVGVGHHHALGEQALERLVALDQPFIPHQLVEEARVQQVQHGMLDAADVLVDRQPVFGALVQHRRIVARRGVAGVVPARLEEGVEGVGLALGRPAAHRAGGVDELAHRLDRRLRAVHLDIGRQDHGELVFRHRHRAAASAVDDRDRAAPVALAGDPPVAQAVVDLGVALAVFFKVRGDGVEGMGRAQAVERAGMDQHALVGEGSLAEVEALARFRGDDLMDRQAIFLRELKITRVMRGHGHDRPGAVFHQHEVGGPHRHLLAADRVDGGDAQRQALLLQGGHVGLGHLGVAACLDEGGKLRIALGGLLGQRVLGGDGDVGDAHQGVRAGGVDGQGLAALDLEVQLHAHRAPDPVGLHGAHLFRPAVEGVEVVEQLLGVVGDAERPLRDLAALDQRAGAPAASVDDLLVGEHGLVHRVPVHHRGLLVGDALLHQAGEQPLLPAVVVRQAGGQLARPVVAEAQRLELAAHVVDVGEGPRRRGDVVGQRRVLGRQAEGVPAHRLEHVLAVHALEAGDHVADGVVAHMPHVQLAAGVGEHRQAVELFLRRVFLDVEDAGGVPALLGVLFDGLGAVLLVHGGAGVWIQDGQGYQMPRPDVLECA